MEPEDSESFFTASDEDLERMKRCQYAKLLCETCNPPKTSYILATYNAANTTDAVQLLDTTDNKVINSKNCTMYIDGVETEIPDDGSYTFATAGEHTVKYVLKTMDDCRYMFYGCSNLTGIDLSNFDISNVTSTNYMFGVCENLSTVEFGYQYASNLTDTGCMFNGCSSLESLYITWYISNVTQMSYMFWNCTKLTFIDLRNVITSNVVKYGMDFLFNNCGTDAQELNVLYFYSKSPELETMPTNNPSYIRLTSMDPV